MHFNPRAPCGARLLWFKYSTEFIYFNPRAPCGARRTEHGEAVIREKFQSTRPVWGATKAAAGDRPRQLISIHAPRVGRDGLHALFVQQGRISIHAPRVGRDSGRLSLSLPLYLFQSTRPVWGATGETWNRSNGGERFQSTRPVWGATRRSSTAGASSLFQSTRPVWGATFLRSIGAKRCTKFQSTRPVWGATGGDQLFDLCGTISIHAPRVGRDAIRPRCRSKMPYFNPRAPCGARLYIILALLSTLFYFNPRAPCGARPLSFFRR